jgi:hypothetical protein
MFGFCVEFAIQADFQVLLLVTSISSLFGAFSIDLGLFRRDSVVRLWQLGRDGTVP